MDTFRISVGNTHILNDDSSFIILFKKFFIIYLAAVYHKIMITCDSQLVKTRFCLWNPHLYPLSFYFTSSLGIPLI